MAFTLHRRVAIKNIRLKGAYIFLVFLTLVVIFLNVFFYRGYTQTNHFDTAAYIRTKETPTQLGKDAHSAGTSFCADLDAGAVQPGAFQRNGLTFQWRPSSCYKPCDGLSDKYDTGMNMWDCKDMQQIITHPSAQDVEVSISWVDYSHNVSHYSPNSSYGEALFGIAKFVEAFEFELDVHVFLTERLPWLFGMHSEALRQGNALDVITTVLDSKRKPWRSYVQTKPVLKLAELLWLAVPWIPNLRDQLGLEGDQPPTEIPRKIFELGASLVLSVHCFTDDYDVAIYLDWWVGGDFPHHASLSRPICLLNVHLMQQYTFSTPVRRELYHEADSTGEQVSRTRLRWHQEQRIVFGPGLSGGRVRCISLVNAIYIMALTIVLITLPGRIMSLFTCYLLGNLSSIYKRAIVQPFNLLVDSAATAASLMSHSVAFMHLADSAKPAVRENHEHMASGERVHAQAISHSRVQQRLAEAMHLRGSILTAMEINLLTDKCLECIVETGPGAVDVDQFSVACLHHGTMDFESIITLFDADRNQHCLERFFTPRSLRRIVKKSAENPEDADNYVANVAVSLEREAEIRAQEQRQTGRARELFDGVTGDQETMCDDMEQVDKTLDKLQEWTKMQEAMLEDLTKVRSAAGTDLKHEAEVGEDLANRSRAAFRDAQDAVLMAMDAMRTARSAKLEAGNAHTEVMAALADAKNVATEAWMSTQGQVPK